MTDSSLAQVAPDDVGRKARKGAWWSALQIGGRNILSVGSTAILARLLTPDDYGLLGMVATLTALLQVFSDMGLSWATIQRKSLSATQVSNLFWINAAAGLLLWGACLVVAPLVASFYGRAELQAVTMVMGASFLLGGLAVQPFALLRRRMEYRRIAAIEIVALIVAAGSAIAAAIGGLGYWALVVQALVAQLVRLVCVWPICGLALQAPCRDAGTRSMIGFGGLLALNGLLIYAARNLDSVFLGHAWGSEALGYYNRAYFLMLLPSMLATSVLSDLMVPSLSALQGDPERFGNAYRRALRVVAFIGCPMSLGLALTASEVVHLVYGPQWEPVVPMLIWLSIAGITQPIYNTTGWLFTAKARAGIYLLLTGVNAVILGLAFWVGARFGPVAVAQAYGIVMGLLLLWPALALAHLAGGIRLRDSTRALLPVAVCLAALLVAVLVVAQAVRFLDLVWWATLTLKVVTGAFAYAAAARLWARPMLHEDLLPMLPIPIRTCVQGWI